MKSRVIVLLAALAWAFSASAQEETLLDYIKTSCAADMENYCADVTPGEGRLMYCAAAYQDQLSEQCKGALANAALLLADLTNQVVLVADACDSELMNYCADVEIGDGRVLQCLDDNDDKLSDICEEALDTFLD